MAHIGRFYRLHFRRDVLITRLGHRYGLGVDYFMKLKLGSILGGLEIFVTDYKPMSLTTAYDEFPIRWESAPFTQSGHSWQMTFQLDGWEFEFQRAAGLLALYRNEVLSGTWQLFAIQDTAAGSWSQSIGRQQPIYWNESHWPYPPSLRSGTIGTPKKWNGQPVVP